MDELFNVPFEDIIMKGKGQKFVCNMLKVLKIFAAYQRPNLFKCMEMLVWQMDWVLKNSPADAAIYFANVCYCTDELIELHNSLIGQQCSKNCSNLSAEYISEMSVQLAVSRSMLPDTDDIIGSHKKNVSVTSTAKQGEIRLNEQKHLSHNAAEDHCVIDKWILDFFTRIEENDPTLDDSQSSSSTSPSAASTFDGMLKQGLINGLIFSKRFESHLNKVAYVAAASRTAGNVVNTGDAEEEDNFYLFLKNNKIFTIPILKCALKSKNKNISGSRDDLISRVVLSLVQRDFLIFVIDNELNCTKDAENWLDAHNKNTN